MANRCIECGGSRFHVNLESDLFMCMKCKKKYSWLEFTELKLGKNIEEVIGDVWEETVESVKADTRFNSVPASPDFVIRGGTLFEYRGAETDVVIPEEVCKIGDKAFAKLEYINSVTFPDELQEIGKQAFSECKSLKRVKTNRNLKVIENNAFEKCTALKQINLNFGLVSIGEAAFSGCKSLKELMIPGGVKKIGKYAFENCSSLKKLGIPESVENLAIDSCLTEGCSKLEKITYPQKKVGKAAIGAFRNSLWFENRKIQDAKLRKQMIEKYRKCPDCRGDLVWPFYNTCPKCNRKGNWMEQSDIFYEISFVGGREPDKKDPSQKVILDEIKKGRVVERKTKEPKSVEPKGKKN